MESKINLSEYLSGGIENIIKNIIKSSIKNPRESSFMVKEMVNAKNLKAKRDSFEKLGEHIPPFLMASIATNCNLFCKGCYARANKSCGNNLEEKEMSKDKWKEIFIEAKELGIAFILLLGGEPLMRMDVIKEAAYVSNIIFPIFTNGTMINDEYIELFNKNRNLVPMISIEGDRNQTDERRGIGTYNKIMLAMDSLKDKGILFGASITVTTKNIESVLSSDFINKLYSKGARVILFSEYVPAQKGTEGLAPSENERIYLEERVNNLRESFKNMVFLSFPGDEKALGGCISAGRGFFHINANGGAEACPFSPYSDSNIRNMTLREALKSPLFKKIRESGKLLEDHDGGCVLYDVDFSIENV